MKPKYSIKTLYRSPVKTVLTFILLVAVTFTLFSQVLEHAVTVREIDKAAEQYTGVGAVEVSPTKANTKMIYYITNDERVSTTYPSVINSRNYEGLIKYEPLSQDTLDNLYDLPYVTSIDTRYMTAGVIDDYNRIDEGNAYFNFTAQCVIEGTFENASVLWQDEFDEDVRTYDIRFSNCKVLGGVAPERIDGSTLAITTERGGSHSGTVGRYSVYTVDEYPYKPEFVENLIEGNRYAFVVRFEPLAPFYKGYSLGDYLTETYSNSFWDVENAPDNYIETDEYSDLCQVIEIINLNIHTFDAVYTDDMGSIMRFANGNMMIADGRGISPEDSETNPNICVISRDFAMKNELQVGDFVTIKLGDKLFEQYKGLGAVPTVPGRVSDSYTEVNLEIVGIYVDIDSAESQAAEPHWSYSINTLFVPKALLNVSEAELANHTFAPGEVSFVIEDAWDIPSFLEEGSPIIEEMGLTMIFEDENWLDMVDGFTASKELAVIKIGVLSAAVLVATWFVAMLYIVGRKKDYAIMRVLGTTVRKSNASMLLPFMTLVLASVFVGALAAYINTSRTIVNSNALQVLSEFAIDSSIPVGVLILCVLSELALGFAIAFAMLASLGKKPPLVLMQGDGAKRKKLRKIFEEPQEPIAFIDWEVTPIEKLKKHPKYARRFVWKYIFRHIKRTSSKALLTMVLGVLLLNVIGQLDIMKRSYSNLVDNTEITSNYVGGLQLDKIFDVSESGYAKSIYYTSETRMDLNGMSANIVLTNNMHRYMDTNSVVSYLEGYDVSSFETLDNVLLISDVFAENNGLGLGDTVILSPDKYMENAINGYIKSHRNENPDDTKSDDEIIALYIEKITSDYSRVGTEMVIIGIFSVTDEETIRFDDYVFTPGVNNLSDTLGLYTPLDIAEATVADNNLVDEYREFGQNLAGGSVTEGVMFVMDTSKLENLRNTLRLVEMLYPIAVIVTLVIGAFLCGLIIVQTSKDIAIMRVLGTSKAKTRTILVLEQMILCIIGIIISGMVIYIRGALIQMLWIFGVYAIVILFASIVASIAASRKNVLELLQTKE